MQQLGPNKMIYSLHHKMAGDYPYANPVFVEYAAKTFFGMDPKGVTFFEDWFPDAVPETEGDSDDEDDPIKKDAQAPPKLDKDGKPIIPPRKALSIPMVSFLGAMVRDRSRCLASPPDVDRM